MCTIIFLDEIPLHILQTKQELHGGGGGGGGGALTRGSLPGLYPGSDGDLGGPQTPCLTRNETLVTALESSVKPTNRDSEQATHCLPTL